MTCGVIVFQQMNGVSLAGRRVKMELVNSEQRATALLIIFLLLEVLQCHGLIRMVTFGCLVVVLVRKSIDKEFFMS